MTIIIYHNPNCGTSRNVLNVFTDAGYTPKIIEYLTSGWTADQLRALFEAAGVTPRQALRETKSPAKELGLLNADIGDEALLDAMILHPILVNRPFVVTDKGTKLCRPSEVVLDLIDRWPNGPYLKEDGSLMIDAHGNRVG